MCRPYGTRTLFWNPYLALKRWEKLYCAYGAGLPVNSPAVPAGLLIFL
jgi:hypothetical protein